MVVGPHSLLVIRLKNFLNAIYLLSIDGLLFSPEKFVWQWRGSHFGAANKKKLMRNFLLINTNIVRWRHLNLTWKTKQKKPTVFCVPNDMSLINQNWNSERKIFCENSRLKTRDIKEGISEEHCIYILNWLIIQ